MRTFLCVDLTPAIQSDLLENVEAEEKGKKEVGAFVRLAVKFIKEEIRIIVSEDSDCYLLSFNDSYIQDITE